MTGMAARVEARVAPDAPAGSKPAFSEAQTEGMLKLATFLALAAFALGHWESVISHAPVGRSVALLVLCGAAGVALMVTAAPEVPPLAGRIARPLIVLALVVLSLLLTGLRARYLHHWGAFGGHLHHGLLGAQSTTYPYDGTDHWVRLTLGLAAPAFLVPATALAFWPAGRATPVLRGMALVVLIVFYGMALAERSPAGQIGRGIALLLLIAAWLWLPRLKMRDAGAASVVVIAAALVALPLAAKLDSSKGWLDYKNWRVLGDTAGVHYSWNASYGPINWPRRGTTLLYIQANRPYYWKAETLNDFDGRRWLRTSANAGVSASSELPAAPDRRWFTQVKVTVAGLRGNQVIGAGTPQSVSSGAGDTELAGDGTVTSLGDGLHDSENYTVNTYDPQPTATQLRNSPPIYEGYFGVYTKLILPMRVPGGGSNVMQDVRYDPGLWTRGVQDSGDPAAPSVALHSPYAPMYRLARRMAAKSNTPYDMVRNVEDYLKSTRFAYDEKPLAHKYPLESFLFKDRIGYCQQFSGTMAMMLRMVGIPTRVVTGFAPGTPQPGSAGVYKVRDLDAHSWVEVYFTDIGWVTFDPTPAVAPAASQGDDTSVAAVGSGRAPRQLGQSLEHDAAGFAGSAGVLPSSDKAFPWWAIPLGLVALVALALLGWRVERRFVMRSHLRADERLVEDLCLAMGRLGNPVPAGATLTTVERTLERRAGPEAGRYARQLRDYRYGGNGATLPRSRDRRALRRALARTARPFGMLKALRAFPPLHF
jgi:transglutaminase-like putative cysteine protease